MKHLMECVNKVKEKSILFHDRLIEEYRVDSLMRPVCAFNMIANNLTLSLELMQYYSGVFLRPDGERFEDNVTKNPEQTSRILVLQSSSFVSIVSALEACAKIAVVEIDEYFPKTKKSPAYLRDIMQRAKGLRWISIEDETAWGNVVDVRNKLVHSNGEYGSSYEFTLPNGLTWSFVRGRKALITLRHYPETISWMLDAYFRWCQVYLSNWVKRLDYSPDKDMFFLSVSSAEKDLGFDYRPSSDKSRKYVFASKHKVIPVIEGSLIFY